MVETGSVTSAGCPSAPQSQSSKPRLLVFPQTAPPAVFPSQALKPESFPTLAASSPPHVQSRTVPWKSDLLSTSGMCLLVCFYPMLTPSPPQHCLVTPAHPTPPLPPLPPSSTPPRNRHHSSSPSPKPSPSPHPYHLPITTAPSLLLLSPPTPSFPHLPITTTLLYHHPFRLPDPAALTFTRLTGIAFQFP